MAENENGRYWLFLGDDYDSYGGFNDFIAASDNIDELRKRVDMGSEDCYEDGFDPRGQWWHIVDTKTATIVDGHESWDPNDEMQKRMDMMNEADRVIEESRPKSGLNGKTGGDDKSSESPIYEESTEQQ